MPDRPTGIDPQVLEDLRAVEQFCRLLALHGRRTEFWEAYCLARDERAAVHLEIARLGQLTEAGHAGEIDAALSVKLDLIRRDMGTHVNGLRKYLLQLPVPMDGLALDLTLVFIMASDKGRQSALGWLSDPQGQLSEAALRITVMKRLVEGYRRALLDSRIAPSAAVPAAPPANGPLLRDEAPANPAKTPTRVLPSSTPAPENRDDTAPSSPPSRVYPPVLKDLRRVQRCQVLLKGLENVATWEILSLLLIMREDTRAAVDELYRLKREGRPGEFAGEAYALRQKLRLIRAKYGDFVKALRDYLGVLAIPGWGGPADEMALGFLVASSHDRRRAERWLREPETCRLEAVHHMAEALRRALLHHEELERESAETVS